MGGFSALGLGCGAAGLNRFPSIGVVFNTLKVKNRFAKDKETTLSYKLLDRLKEILDANGQLNSVESRSGKLGVLSLRTAVRMVRDTDEQEADGGGRPWKRLRLNKMLQMVESIDSGQRKAVMLAQKRVLGDGVVSISLYDGSKPADRDRNFSWVLVRNKTSRKKPDSATAMRQSMELRYLPQLANIATSKLPKVLPREDVLASELGVLEKAWNRGGTDTPAIKHLIWGIRNATRDERDIFVRSVDVVGSRLYGVCTKYSDIDVSVTVRVPEARSVEAFKRFCSRLESKLRQTRGFNNVVWIKNARVPVMKLQLNFAQHAYGVDITFNNGLAAAKSKMLAAYMHMDPRVRVFMTLLKHWGQQRQITDSNVVNSYGLMLMGLAFLIRLRVVPPLQLLSSAWITSVGWKRLGDIQRSPEEISKLYANVFCVQTEQALPRWDVEGHAGYYAGNRPGEGKWMSPNTMTAYELLFEMFKFYGTRFDPVRHAISPRLGMPCVPRTSLPELDVPTPDMYISRPQTWGERLRLLAIEDPFELSLNCARNARPAWVEGMLWEMRRAAYVMAQSLGDPDAAMMARLFMPPTAAVYPDAGIWAPVYSRLLNELQKGIGEQVFQEDRDVCPENTIDLQQLEGREVPQKHPHPWTRAKAAAHPTPCQPVDPTTKDS